MLQSQSVSQRGLLSISMLLFSVGGLTIAMLAGTKMVFDIFDVGLMESLDGLAIKVIVIALAYLVGWATAILAIRVYGNLVLPFIINIFIWTCLVGICTLYLLILQRLYNQEYDFFRFIDYAAIMVSAGMAMIGDPSPTCTSAVTNIPGRSWFAGLAKLACTCTLRVASSTTELMAVIFPAASRPAIPSLATWTVSPTLIWDTTSQISFRFTSATETPASRRVPASESVI